MVIFDPITYQTVNISAKNIITGQDIFGRYGSVKFVGNEVVYTVTEQHISARIEWLIRPTVGHSYYMSGEIFPLHSAATRVRVGGLDIPHEYPQPGVWNKICSVQTAIDDDLFRFYHATNQYQIGDEVRFKNLIIIDLTEIFGVGNEPTVEQMNMLLSQFPDGWFDGTKNLFNAKHFLNIYHKKIKELENAITALGGGS